MVRSRRRLAGAEMEIGDVETGDWVTRRRGDIAPSPHLPVSGSRRRNLLSNFSSHTVIQRG